MIQAIRSRPRASVSMAGALALLVAACGGPAPTGPLDEAPPAPQLPTGSIQITVATSGASLDPDGYQLLLDGSPNGPIAVDGTLTLEVDVGLHFVQLDGLAFNCYPLEKEPLVATVTEAETTTVALAAHCVTPLTGWLLYTTFSENERAIVRVSPHNPNVSQRLVVGDASRPSITSDGTRLAFERDGFIYTSWVDGTELTRLTEGLDPVWSPDGTRIAFSAYEDPPRRQVYVVAADGSGLLEVSTGERSSYAPDWSPDGRELVYVDSAPTGERRLVRRSVDTSAPPTILLVRTAELVAPAWSPDGETIAFVESDIYGPEIFLIAAAGGVSTEPRVLTDEDDTLQETEPTWSPDGLDIVYVSVPPIGPAKLWRTSVFRFAPQRVFPASGTDGDEERHPVFAPAAN